MQFLSYLFDGRGFPNISTYGQSWQPWLYWLFVFSRGMAAGAYLLLCVCFVKFGLAWKAGEINLAAGAIHGPRVAKFYLASAALELLVQAGGIVIFWYPAIRALGVLTFLASSVLLAAAFKTVWALSCCIKDPGAPK